MSQGQFRFSYFTADYDSTVAFYGEGLELPVIESWDRNPDDRGTLFGAASGIIEVLVSPKSSESSHLFDDRPPQGAFMVIEVEDAEQEYRRAVQKGTPIKQKLRDQEWGHRSLCVTDPNGLILYFFKEVPTAG